MKLETMMVNEDGEWVPKADTDFFPGMELKHDAAAAHALLIAMGEADPDSDYRLGTELQRIRTRADEILAEWGYGDGCG